MSTFMQRPQDVRRQWYIIDAAGKPLGRVAAVAAHILRGKHKPTFTPHVDCGDHVIILNCENAVLTGNKLQQKTYYRHTGYIGGLKAVKYKDLMAARPEKAMMMAVAGMLPKTSMGRKSLTRLRAHRGNQHDHQAQCPEPWAGEIK